MVYEIVGSLTNPQKHDPNEYLYVGHSIQGFQAGELDELGVRTILEHLTTPDKYFSACLLGRSEGELVQKFGWSFPPTFDQTAPHTFVGFLINPQGEYGAEDKIPIAWNCDLGSPMNQQELKAYVNQYRGKRRSLYQLLTQSLGACREFPRNELIVEGTPDSIVGVFYVDVRGQRNFSGDGEALSEVTNTFLGYELPLIEIVHNPPRISEESDIERTVKDQGHEHALSKALAEFKEGRQSLEVSGADTVPSFLKGIDPETVRRLLELYK